MNKIYSRRFLCACVIFSLCALTYAGCGAPPGRVEKDADARLLAAYQTHQSGFFIEAEGLVTRVLADDLQGSRHQRFIVRLATGQTLLVAYNIDLARRIEGLKIGDRVRFRGQYEWNDKGGVIHWTHRDPANRFPGGWIEHTGQRYQ